MDAVPGESHASSWQVSPRLRQRMLNRASTFAEGVQPVSPQLVRRRSSLLSDLSDSRPSMRSSSDNLLRRNNTDEPTHWISIPVVAAIVPAIVGLTYENGAAIATDVLLLALASWFLHWCVRVPWDWYHEAQQRQYDYGWPDDMPYDDTILEEDEDGVESPDDPQDPLKPKDEIKPPPISGAQQRARQELKRQELFAFISCFLGPLFGALLLHTIRDQLTRAEGIVNNFNLVIFFLGAEIRPCRHLIKMKQEKTLHLQRIVHTDARDQPRTADAQQLSQRLTVLETQLADGPPSTSELDISKLSADVRQTTQLQLDALNRAVRRYEKRHIAQSIQIEARFQELDAQLKDALALAAAAARTGQRPGMIASMCSWVAGLVAYVLQTTWNILTYPLRTAAAVVALVKSLFVKDVRQGRRTGRAQGGGNHSSMAASRMQAKSAR